MSENTTFLQKVQAKLPSYWKLATVRCSIYALIVGWGSFQTCIEGYDSFTAMTHLQIFKMIGNILESMLGVWLAFLDQSLSKLNNTKPEEPPKTS